MGHPQKRGSRKAGNYKNVDDILTTAKDNSELEARLKSQEYEVSTVKISNWLHCRLRRDCSGGFKAERE